MFSLNADPDVSFSQTVPSRICPKKCVWFAWHSNSFEHESDDSSISSIILFFTITDGEKWEAGVKDVKVERVDMTKEVGVEAMGEKVTGDKAAVVEGLDMTKEVGVEAMGEKVTGVKMAVVEGVDMADVVVVVVLVKEVGGWVKEAFFEMKIFFWAARQISIKID